MEYKFTPKEINLALSQVPLNRLLMEIETRFALLESQIPKEDDSKKKMYSVPQVADLCGVKISSVQRWVREEIYPARKMGRSYFFSQETFNRIKAERGIL